MNSTKKPLIVIAGPTASGKTELSISLAKRVNGEIISGDSMQVYKYLNIGTAKITPEDMDGVPHHLIDIIEPAEDYNVQLFQESEKKIIEDIHKRNKVPILVGGTGLYIDSLVYDYSFINESPDNSIRNKLWDEFHKHGSIHIIAKLREKDPDSLSHLDLSNTKRIIRALEIIEKNNINFSELEKNSRTEKESPYNLYYFVITMNRDELYDRINKRVDLMFEKGWLDEVKSILESGIASESNRSMQGLGYRQIIQYLNGEIKFEECIEKIKQETRRFAKRQLTWFRKNKNVIWFDKNKNKFEEIWRDLNV